MKTKTIKVQLSPSSIDRAIKELEAYKKRIKLKLMELIDVMCMDGEDYACSYLTHVDTGETLQSIMGYREGNHGIIEAGGAAVWIEFGTGVAFNVVDYAHPTREDLGISDWGEYGKGKGANPNGWYYYGKDNKLHFTQGIPSEPFMQYAADKLIEEFRATAVKVFAK